ncbi:MAG TPA: heavy metal translocating P-type ATPase [Woeseiaceae bacterium]|nr:heavy metal translocating P-type ATPase [Woeseiaceae bacterium]
MSGKNDCYHCGEPVPSGPEISARVADRYEPVCCAGCKAVSELIHANGLSAYYEYRSRPDPDAGLRPQPSEWAHYDTEDMQSRFVHREGDSAETTVEVGGMYCSACVWLLENALKRQGHTESVTVSPATRRAVIRWDAAAMPFSELLDTLAAVGFRPRPLAAGHAADPAHDEYRRALKRLLVAAAAGMQVMMFAVALYAGDFFGIDGAIEKFLRTVSLLISLPIVFYSARPFFSGAWRGLRARSPGMDLPVAIAIAAAFVASVRATLLDQGEIYFDSVAMFVLFLSASRFLEMRARHRSGDQAYALASLLPDAAIRVRDDGSEETVSVDSLRAGEVVRIRAGDVMPVDGEVESGNLFVDESMLTGESLPVRRSSRMQVLAGSINRDGIGNVRVIRTGAGTSLAEVGRLLERAKADRPPVAQLADRVASYFVVGVLILVALTGAVWSQIDPSRAFEVVLATLVVTCPCALALATPTALAAAASTLASNGFLLVRSRLLEVLGHGAVLVFDKTGTLTEGRPTVQRTECYRDDWSASRCLALAAAIETASTHVLARAFAAHERPGEFTIGEIDIAAGQGVEADVDGTRWRIGSAAFVAGLVSTPFPAAFADQSCTHVLLGSEEGMVAQFAIGDEVRADARETLHALQSAGFRTLIASGDREAAVASVAVKLGIREWHSAMLPEHKVSLVGKLRAGGTKVVMVGDGINDAPVLAAADASIALDAGTALARATADAVVLGKRLGSVVDGVRVARFTRRIIRQNIAWAIAYNLTAVPLAASGMLAPWMAALGMSLSSLVVVANATRVQRQVGNGPKVLSRAEPRVPAQREVPA